MTIVIPGGTNATANEKITSSKWNTAFQAIIDKFDEPGGNGIDATDIDDAAVIARCIAAGAVTLGKLATDGNGPAAGSFYAYRAATLSLASDAAVVFDNDSSGEAFDTSGWYDTSNGRFTPLTRGVYRVSWCLSASAALTADDYWTSYLKKATTRIRNGSLSFQRGTKGLQSVGAAVVKMNGTTDYLQVFTEHDGGTESIGVTDESYTFFCGGLIGPTT